MTLVSEKMYSEDIKNIIQKLALSLFSGSLQFNINPEEIEQFTWDKQKTFLDITINSPRFKKYPVNSNFCRLFFKKLINYLEPLQDVHDDIYSFLCYEMNKSSEDYFYYRHYIVNNNVEDSTIIKETKNMVVNGTTGLKTWEAAFVLSDWALGNKNIFFKKKVMELGSGVGFSGITIAKHLDISCMYITDCHPDVLKTLRDNIEINLPDYMDPQCNHTVTRNNRSKSIGTEILKLDWNCEQDLPNDIVPDVVIGADIIYDPSILEPLCNILQLLVIRNPQIEIYICSVVRNEDTHSAFLDILDSSNFSFEKILHIGSNYVKWDQSLNICLLKITKAYKDKE